MRTSHCILLLLIQIGPGQWVRRNAGPTPELLDFHPNSAVVTVTGKDPNDDPFSRFHEQKRDASLPSAPPALQGRGTELHLRHAQQPPPSPQPPRFRHGAASKASIDRVFTLAGPFDATSKGHVTKTVAITDILQDNILHTCLHMLPRRHEVSRCLAQPRWSKPQAQGSSILYEYLGKRILWWGRRREQWPY